MADAGIAPALFFQYLLPGLTATNLSSAVPKLHRTTTPDFPISATGGNRDNPNGSDGSPVMASVIMPCSC